jgi:hypothetical protein
VPEVPSREEVEDHLSPDTAKDTLEIRIWWNSQTVHSIVYPLKAFPRVHFSEIPNIEVGIFPSTGVYFSIGPGVILLTF